MRGQELASEMVQCSDSRTGASTDGGGQRQTEPSRRLGSSLLPCCGASGLRQRKGRVSEDLRSEALGKVRRPGPSCSGGWVRCVVDSLEDGLDVLEPLLEGTDHLHETDALIQQDHVGVLVLRRLVLAHREQELELLIQQVLLPRDHTLVELQGLGEVLFLLNQFLLCLLHLFHGKTPFLLLVLVDPLLLNDLCVGPFQQSLLRLGALLDDLADFCPYLLQFLLGRLGHGLPFPGHLLEGALLGFLRLLVDLLILHLQLIDRRLRHGLRGATEVEGLNPQQHRCRDTPVVRGNLQPAGQAPPHLLVGDPVEANGALLAGLDQLLGRKSVDAFPHVVSVLSAQLGDVVPKLHLHVALPPVLRLWQAEHARERTELVVRHFLEGQLLLEELAESQYLFQGRVLRTLEQLILELLELNFLVRVLFIVRLHDFLRALVDDFLEELGHLLLRLELPSKRRIVVLLLEESGGQHAGE
mmetsp:Transcript_30383/g.77713  ORF Transcript_30383/g.77713 Transcript_30383/m.77713 type:complete len:471 (-) Transcript_30383:767-2179(-)